MLSSHLFWTSDLWIHQPGSHRSVNNELRYVLYTAIQQCTAAVCVVIPFILDFRIVDVPAGVTQEGGRTGFLQLPSTVPALIFLARRFRPFLSLVDREVEFCVFTN